MLDLDVTGLTQVGEHFDGIARRVADPRRALRSVSDFLGEEEARVFATRGASIDAPWRPLSKATIRLKKARAPGRETDRLYRSVTQKKPASGTRSVSRSELRHGTRVPHAHLFTARRALYRKTPHIENTIRQILRDFILDDQL